MPTRFTTFPTPKPKGVETEASRRDIAKPIYLPFFSFPYVCWGFLLSPFSCDRVSTKLDEPTLPHRAHARTLAHTYFVFAPQTDRLVPRPASFPLSTRFNCAPATPHCCLDVLLSARFIDDSEATLRPPVASRPICTAPSLPPSPAAALTAPRSPQP